MRRIMKDRDVGQIRSTVDKDRHGMEAERIPLMKTLPDGKSIPSCRK